MPHQGDADHFFSFCEGAWILRWAEGREATGTTRAGVEAARPAPPLEWAIFLLSAAGARCSGLKRCLFFFGRSCRVWKSSPTKQAGISSEMQQEVAGSKYYNCDCDTC